MMILFDPDLGADLDPDPATDAPLHAGAHSSAARVRAVPRKSSTLSPRSLARFLREAQAAVRLRGQVTVLLTTDAKVRSLNRRFRGKNKTTDVLSFPAEDSGPEKIAGDLAISVPVARKQGVACGHSLATELKVLMLHGLLHLAGYDHETDSGEMARRECVLRARLKLPLGLIERVGNHVPAARKATAGPSTSSAMADFAQDDSKKKTRKRMLSHPSRKNKNAARVGHPISTRRREP